MRTKNIILIILIILASISIYLLFPRSNVESTALEIHKECASEGLSCFEKGLSETTKEHGFQFGMAVLSSLQKLDPQTTACHDIAHVISLAALEKDHTNWKKLLASVSPEACLGGFMHGLLEGAARYEPDFQLSGATVDDLCPIYPSSQGRAGCAHIFGHLFLVEQEANVTNSIQLCDSVQLKESIECYTGIFMEYMEQKNMLTHGLVNKRRVMDAGFVKELETMCESFSGRVKHACWGEMGFVYVSVYHQNPSPVYSKCMSLETEDIKDSCYWKGAAMIAVNTENREYIYNICSPYIDSPKMDTCTTRVVNALLQATSQNILKAADFCTNSGNQDTKPCFKFLYSNSDTKELSRVCKSKTSEIKQLCSQT